MHYVKNVKYLREYELSVSFEDGSMVVVDLQPHLRGDVFKPLKKIPYFKKVRVNRDIDTICWPNGADFSPEFIYKIGKRQQKRH